MDRLTLIIFLHSVSAMLYHLKRIKKVNAYVNLYNRPLILFLKPVKLLAKTSNVFVTRCYPPTAFIKRENKFVSFTVSLHKIIPRIYQRPPRVCNLKVL